MSLRRWASLAGRPGLTMYWSQRPLPLEISVEIWPVKVQIAVVSHPSNNGVPTADAPVSWTIL